MHSTHHLALALVCWLSMFRLLGCQFTSASEKNADEFAESFLTGEFGQSVSLFHFPPTYTDAERAEEEAGMRAALESLSMTLGTPATIKKRVDDSFVAVDFTYRVLVRGGDNPYWENRPLQISSTISYEADFPNYPEASIYVELIPGSDSSHAEIWQAGVGIPAETPGSKDYALMLAEVVAVAMGIDISDKTRALMHDQVSAPGILGLPD